MGIRNTPDPINNRDIELGYVEVHIGRLKILTDHEDRIDAAKAAIACLEGLIKWDALANKPVGKGRT